MVGARDAEKAAAGARTEATLPRDHDGKGDMTSDAEREEHESASSSAVAASIPRGKILVVDDEPEIRETVRRILSKEGYEADIAESGRIALDKLESFRPALVLCDYVAGADRRLGYTDPNLAFLKRVPSAFLTAKAREPVVRKLRRRLAEATG